MADPILLPSILPIDDPGALDRDVVDREQHWKKVLLTREHGYNRN